MKIYTVAWYIDVNAKSMKDAVKKANSMLEDPEHFPWAFIVAPFQEPVPMKDEKMIMSSVKEMK